MKRKFEKDIWYRLHWIASVLVGALGLGMVHKVVTFSQAEWIEPSEPLTSAHLIYLALLGFAMLYEFFYITRMEKLLKDE